MLDRLRNESYTGPNRCRACSVVNGLITVGLAGGAGAAAAIATDLIVAAAVSGVVLVVGALSIWLRGYLVPGTPTLTKRYMPSWMLAWFGKAPATRAGAVDASNQVATAPGFDIESHLTKAGVLTKAEDGADLAMTASFREAFEESVSRVDNSVALQEGLDALGFDEPDVSLEHFGEAIVVRRFDSDVMKWPSRTAIRVDVATARALDGQDAEWGALSPVERAQLVQGVRLFVGQCPDGDEAVFKSDRVASCCSSYEVAAVECIESGDRIFEQPVDAV